VNAREAIVMLNYFYCSGKKIFLKVVFNVKLLPDILLLFIRGKYFCDCKICSASAAVFSFVEPTIKM